MRRTNGAGGAWVAAAIAAAVLGAGAAPQALPKKPDAGPAAQDGVALRFLPKARRMSTYSLSGRFELTTRDVTFEAPEAYRDGFNFWSNRMKGVKRSEVYEIVTMTQDADESGKVTFRRTVPKMSIEILRQGQVLEPMIGTERSVTTQVWEGTMDAFGNVKEMRKVAGVEDAEIAGLAIPEVSRSFPEVDGPRPLKLGEGFKEERVVRLPTRLSIAGLEQVTVLMTREYTLKSVRGDQAVFDVKLTYALDPAFKPSAEKTTCAIGGGGTGEATFDARRGVFLRSRVPSTMTIDIEAPLRPLPDHPETKEPGLGKSHITLDLLVSGDQTVRRVWGEEDD